LRDPSTESKLIIRVTDQLKAEEVRLVDCTPEKQDLSVGSIGFALLRGDLKSLGSPEYHAQGGPGIEHGAFGSGTL
jgi:hypothetical protein